MSADEEDPKDISDMIQITNEMAFVGEGGTEPEESEEKDCLLPSCPIDTSALDGATASLKGAIDDHVVPKVDETTQSIRGAFDEHVAPKVTETTMSIRGAYDEHLAPKVTETTATIKGAFDEHVVPKVTETSATIKGCLDEHVVPRIESAKEHSMRTMDTITVGSQKLLSDVQENSKKGVEVVQRQSMALVERSKSTMESVSTKTVAFVDETVKPGFQNLVTTSERAISTTAEELQTHAPVYMGTAPGWTNLLPTVYWTLLSSSLRAYGRVVFCDNPVTGIFILLGILCASPLGGFCSILSVLTANATAMYLDMDKDSMASGMYARNAVLIGTGVVASFDFEFPETGNLKSGVSILLFLSIALAPTTLLVESIWMKKVPSSIPSLLLPFNIVLLTTLICAKCWNYAMATQVLFVDPNLGVLLDDIEAAHSTFLPHVAVLNGLSKIFFVEGSLAGFLILLGILLCSRIIAASLLVGSFVSSFVLGYMVFAENHWYLNSGFAGFNPALCAAGIFFYLVPSWKLTGLAFFAIVATVIMQGAVDVLLGILGMPVSTSLGFCFTLIPLLAMDLGEFFGNPDYFIRSIPETELSTPEDYIKTLDPDPPTDSSSSEEDVEAQAAGEETPLLA